MPRDFGGSTSGTQPDSWGAATPAPSLPSTPPVGGGVGGSAGQVLPDGEGASSPPILWLGAAFATAVASIAVFLLSGGHTVAVGGWLLAGPVTVALLAVFFHLDTKRRADSWYAASMFADWGRRGVVALALTGVAMNAWTIADAAGRGSW